MARRIAGWQWIVALALGVCGGCGKSGLQRAMDSLEEHRAEESWQPSAVHIASPELQQLLADVRGLDQEDRFALIESLVVSAAEMKSAKLPVEYLTHAAAGNDEPLRQRISDELVSPHANGDDSPSSQCAARVAQELEATAIDVESIRAARAKLPVGRPVADPPLVATDYGDLEGEEIVEYEFGLIFDDLKESTRRRSRGTNRAAQRVAGLSPQMRADLVALTLSKLESQPSSDFGMLAAMLNVLEADSSTRMQMALALLKPMEGSPKNGISKYNMPHVAELMKGTNEQDAIKFADRASRAAEKHLIRDGKPLPREWAYAQTDAALGIGSMMAHLPCEIPSASVTRLAKSLSLYFPEGHPVALEHADKHLAHLQGKITDGQATAIVQQVIHEMQNDSRGRDEQRFLHWLGVMGMWIPDSEAAHCFGLYWQRYHGGPRDAFDRRRYQMNAQKHLPKAMISLARQHSPDQAKRRFAQIVRAFDGEEDLGRKKVYADLARALLEVIAAEEGVDAALATLEQGKQHLPGTLGTQFRLDALADLPREERFAQLPQIVAQARGDHQQLTAIVKFFTKMPLEEQVQFIGDFAGEEELRPRLQRMFYSWGWGQWQENYDLEEARRLLADPACVGMARLAVMRVILGPREAARRFPLPPPHSFKPG